MHPRYAPVLFGFLLSGLMSLIVAGIATARAAGLGDGFAGLWASAWLSSWAVAFPTVLVVAPTRPALGREGRARAREFLTRRPMPWSPTSSPPPSRPGARSPAAC